MFSTHFYKAFNTTCQKGDRERQICGKYMQIFASKTDGH